MNQRGVNGFVTGIGGNRTPELKESFTGALRAGTFFKMACHQLSLQKRS
jgi:hypothetical protein